LPTISLKYRTGNSKTLSREDIPKNIDIAAVLACPLMGHERTPQIGRAAAAYHPKRASDAAALMLMADAGQQPRKM
jgi:hypothetical protein